MSRPDSPSGQPRGFEPSYGPPSDPWGGRDEGGEPSTHHYGGTYQVGYPGSAWTAPPPRRNRALLVLVGLSVLVISGAVATALYLVSGSENSTAGPTGEPTTTTTPSATPDTSSPADRIGLAASLAVVDDCVVNDGTDERPRMRITWCDADETGPVYRILARFDELVAGPEEAQETCADTEGYEFHYYYVSEGQGPSYVLCMAGVASQP